MISISANANENEPQLRVHEYFFYPPKHKHRSSFPSQLPKITSPSIDKVVHTDDVRKEKVLIRYIVNGKTMSRTHHCVQLQLSTPGCACVA